MKRIVTLLLAIFMVFSLAACGGGNNTTTSEPDSTISEEIKTYLTDHIEYQLKDLRVAEQDETGKYVIVATLGTEYDLDDFVPFTESLIAVSDEAEKQFNVSFAYINPTLYTGEKEWIGWSNDTGKLYNQDEYISDVISADELKTEIEKLLQPNKIPDDAYDFGDMLDPFQGEWKISELSKYQRLIISDDTVNFVHYDNLDKNTVVNDIFTFYFGFDENDKLVVMNQHKQPQYTIEIDESGQLLLQNIPADDKTEIYEKVSDNTEVPEITEKPKIGMSELEVITSTWGTPKKKNKTTTANGTKEQWVYKNGYIYFENGKVTSIQER